MEKFNVVNTSGYDTLLMINIRNTTSEAGRNALLHRLTELGVNGDVQFLTSKENATGRYIWGYKIDNRNSRAIINNTSVATFAMMINANDVRLDIISSETYVDEDGYTYTYTEIERLNDKIIRGINGASCTDFNTNGRTIIEVEVGLV